MHSKLTLGALIVSMTLASCNMIAPRNISTELLDSTGKSTGTATFSATANGARVQIRATGLTPGMHGMHIHTNPSCSNTTDSEGKVTVFGGAGGHFDPGNAGHHGSPTTDNKTGHGGDIPMLNVGADGIGTADFYTDKVSLSGSNSVIGRSIIIHADPDDYKTDPAGNSGARVRCGIIQAPQQ